jgi:hypothetical protein
MKEIYDRLEGRPAEIIKEENNVRVIKMPFDCGKLQEKKNNGTNARL